MKLLFYISLACLVLTACQKNTTLCSNKDSSARPDSITNVQSSSDIRSAIYQDGYSYQIRDSHYTIKEEQITREMWEDAYNHRFEYNYYRDTADSWTNTDAKVAAFRTLSEEGKEAYLSKDSYNYNFIRTKKNPELLKQILKKEQILLHKKQKALKEQPICPIILEINL